MLKRKVISALCSGNAAMTHTSDILEDFKSFSLMTCSSSPPIKDSIAPIELPNANLARYITSNVTLW